MVKQIVGKRSSKNVSVDEYWKTKTEVRARKTENEQSRQRPIYQDLSSIHRFKSDKQKKRELDVNIQSKIQEIQLLPHNHDEDDIGSFWNDELEIQKTSVRYQSFWNFYDEVQPYSQSLALILHNLEKIVDVIMRYLKKEKREIQKIILDMIPPLVRDTQQYLYEIFCNKMLLPLVEMITITDMEVLEKVYNVLAYSFKYLFPEIVRTPNTFYRVYFSRMFSHYNPHIRRFSSDSFSYIIKKAKTQERQQLFELMFLSLQAPEEFIEFQQTTDVEQQNEEGEKDMEIEDEEDDDEENDQELQQKQKTTRKFEINKEDKIKNAIESLGHLLYTSMKGMGYFLNQKAIEIHKHFFAFIMEKVLPPKKNNQSNGNDVNQDKGFELLLRILEICWAQLARKVANRELEDKLIFNFNDIFGAFTQQLITFSSKWAKKHQNQEEQQKNQEKEEERIQFLLKMLNSIAKIQLLILECENGLKLDAISGDNFAKILSCLIENAQHRYESNNSCLLQPRLAFEVNLAEAIAVFLRHLHTKEFYREGSVAEGKIELSTIQNYVLGVSEGECADGQSFTMQQAFQFVQRMTKPHKRSAIAEGLIVKNQEYLVNCYKLNKELLNYVLVVAFNHLEFDDVFLQNDGQQEEKQKCVNKKMTQLNLLLKLALICKFQEGDEEKFEPLSLRNVEKRKRLEGALKKHLLRIVASFVQKQNSQEKEEDEEVKKETVLDFMSALALLKMHQVVGFEELFEIEVQVELEKVRKLLNENVQLDKSVEKAMIEKYQSMDILNSENEAENCLALIDNFYEIPEHIQRRYLLQPFNKISNLSHSDLCIVLKGEVLLSQAKKSEFSTQNQQQQQKLLEIVKAELKMLQNTKAGQNPFFLKNLAHLTMAERRGKNSALPYYSEEQKVLKVQREDFQEAFDRLVDNLQSKYHEIRLFSMRILRVFDLKEEVFESDWRNKKTKELSFLEQKVGSQKKNVSKEENIEEDESKNGGKKKLTENAIFKKMLALMIEIEETPATLQLERAIKLAIGRIKHLIDEQTKDNISLLQCKILLNFFCGYAFVRFQLLWAPVQEMLSMILTMNSKRNNDIEDDSAIYKQFMGHLKFYNWVVLQDKSSLTKQLYEQKNLKQNVFYHQEKHPEVQVQVDFVEIFEDDYYFEADCIEEMIVFDTIFQALINSKATVSKQRVHIQHFFTAFIEKEHNQEKQASDVLVNLGNRGSSKDFRLSDLLVQTNCAQGSLEEQLGKKSYYKKLELFLKVFYQIQGQKNVRKEFFYHYFLRFLQKDNEKVQLLALDNLTKYEIPGINLYRENITNLIKKDTFKTEVVNLSSAAANTVQEAHRAQFLPALVAVLYPKMFSKRGIKHRSAVDVNKNVIFALFSGFSESELKYLLDVIFTDFSIPKSLLVFNPNNEFSAEIMEELSCVQLQKLQTFLNNLKTIFDKIGMHLTPFVPQIFNLILAILQLCHVAKEQLKSVLAGKEGAPAIQYNTNNNSKQSIVLKLIKETNKTAIKRIIELFQKFDFLSSVSHESACRFLTLFEPKIEVMPQDCAKSPSGVLKVLCVFAQNSVYRNHFYSQKSSHFPLFSKLLEIYAVKNLDPKVAAVVHSILKNLILPREQEADTAEKLEKLLQPKTTEENEIEIQNDNNNNEEEEEEDEEEKQQEKSRVAMVQEVGMAVVKRLVQYLRNMFSEQDMKKVKTDSTCLELIYAVLMEYLTLQKQNNSASANRANQKQEEEEEEEYEIVQDALEYFIKFFFETSNSQAQKKIYCCQNDGNGNTEDGDGEFDFSKVYKRNYYKNQIDKAKFAHDKLRREKSVFLFVLQIVEQLVQLFAEQKKKLSTKNDPQQQQGKIAKFYEIVIQQLPYLNDRKLRPRLINIIELLRPEGVISEQITQMLQGMNSQDRQLDRALDYDKVLPLCFDFNTEVLPQSNNWKEIELILLNYLAQIDEEELALKMAIQSGFQAFFDKLVREYAELKPDRKSDGSNNRDSEKEQHLVIKKFVFMRFLPFLQKGIKKAINNEHTLKLLYKLLDMYIFSFSKISKFEKQQTGEMEVENDEHHFMLGVSSGNALYLDLAPLQNKTDLNQDFFEGLFDIQLQKRLKALLILQKNYDKIFSCQMETPAEDEEEEDEEEDNDQEDLVENKKISKKNKKQNNNNNNNHSSSLMKVIIPLLDFIIFNKCQELSHGNKLSFTEVTRSFYKSLLQVSMELYAKCVPQLTWANLKQILKKLMVFLHKKDDKTVVKLMGSIIKNLDPFLFSNALAEGDEGAKNDNAQKMDIFSQVTQEMTLNRQQLSDKGIMKKLINATSQKYKKTYNPEKDEVEKDFVVDQFDKNLKLNEGEEANNETNGEQVDEQVLFKQMEKNALLLQRQQEAQRELEMAMTLKEQQQQQQVNSLEEEEEDQNEEESQRRAKQLEEEQKEVMRIMKEKLEKQKRVTSRQNFLKVTLFIPLKSLLFAKYSALKMEKSNEKVQVHIAIALTNLCSKFTHETFAIEFPKIIAKIAKTLKDKRHDVRDQSRKVLCEIAKISGPYFLHFIFKELKYYLNQGWEGHILNYTIYQLLNTLIQSGTNNNNNKQINTSSQTSLVPIGSIDYCLNDILPALIPEIFGRLQEEKNLDIGKRVPEMKHNKAYECIFLVAKVLNFEDSILNFLSFMKQELVDNLGQSKNAHKFEEMFRNALEGFNKNPSITLHSLLFVAFSLVRDAIQIIENSQVKNHFLDTTQKLDTEESAKAAKMERVTFKKDQTYSILDVTAQNKSIFKEISNMKKHNMFKVGAQLSNFGLKLVLLGIKRQIFTQKLMEENEGDVQTQFEELLKLIVQCLDTSDNNMLQNALKVLKETLVWPIRFIKKHKKSIVKASLEIVQKLTISDTDLIQDTFKLIQIVIHHFTIDQMKPAQMAGLLEFIKQFSEQSDFLTEPLNTLKLLVEKKFIHTEMYTIMDIIKQKMIQCYNRPVQIICKNIFLQFLINYPLSDKLLQNYTNFLIKNTEYTDPHGRTIVYEILQTFLEKFPVQVTNYFGEILFIALLVNQTKEQDHTIVNLNNELIRILLQKLDLQKQLNLLQNCLTWIKQKDEHNQSQTRQQLSIINASFQGMKLFIELGEIYHNAAFKTGFSDLMVPKIKEVFESTALALQQYKAEMKDVQEVKKNLKDSEWKNVLSDTSSGSFEDNLRVYTPALSTILDFVTLLLQKNRNMVRALFFEQKEEQDQKNFLCVILSFIAHTDQTIQNKAVKFLNLLFEKCALDVKEAFDKHRDVVTKHIIPTILKALYVYKVQNHAVIEDTKDQHILVLNAILLFISDSEKSLYLIEHTLFTVKKIAQKALAKTEQNLVVLENILDLYLFLIQQQQKEQVTKNIDSQEEEQEGGAELEPQNQEIVLEFLKDEKHLEHVLVPVIKLKNQEEFLKKQKDCQILEKCELVIENLKRSMDMNIFFKIYSNIKSKMQTQQTEKKVAKKQLAVTDPEQMAQLKKQLNAKRYASKKKQIKNKFKGSVPLKFIKTNGNNGNE